ncbi:MAG TPA: hypothetical protein VMW63_03195 [Methanoregulaceae archaeon]|nr:hypothetical protein [Methanoregulaceae archaeon]
MTEKKFDKKNKLSIMNVFQQMPIWLPPLLAVIIIGVYFTIAGTTDFPGRTVFLLFLLVAFIGMAVITPFRVFLKKNNGRVNWLPLVIASLCAIALFGWFILGGSREIRSGGNFPLFANRFPILGEIIDFIVKILGIGNLAYYPPGYEIIIWGGLFIEIALVSTLIYLLIGHIFSMGNIKEG